MTEPNPTAETARMLFLFVIAAHDEADVEITNERAAMLAMDMWAKVIGTKMALEANWAKGVRLDWERFVTGKPG